MGYYGGTGIEAMHKFGRNADVDSATDARFDLALEK